MKVDDDSKNEANKETMKFTPQTMIPIFNMIYIWICGDFWDRFFVREKWHDVTMIAKYGKCHDIFVFEYLRTNLVLRLVTIGSYVPAFRFQRLSNKKKLNEID